MSESTAYVEGYCAWADGSLCPYVSLSQEWWDWHRGYWQAKQEDFEAQTPYQEGHEAYFRDVDLDDNPYPPSESAHADWNAGWTQGELEVID